MLARPGRALPVEDRAADESERVGGVSEDEHLMAASFTGSVEGARADAVLAAVARVSGEAEAAGRVAVEALAGRWCRGIHSGRGYMVSRVASIRRAS
jgi:hypothetical protein